MSSIDQFLTREDHKALVDEYEAIDSAEEKLSWLMERPPLHAAVPVSLLTPERRVPGCLSGLWLHADATEAKCLFAAKSESDMVQGITSFICDVYSNRPAHEVATIGDSIVSVLGLERLLSTTRKRAVSSTLSFILNTAKANSAINA
jgi:cysteine desulfuration protein SufE